MLNAYKLRWANFQHDGSATALGSTSLQITFYATTITTEINYCYIAQWVCLKSTTLFRLKMVLIPFSSFLIRHNHTHTSCTTRIPIFSVAIPCQRFKNLQILWNCRVCLQRWTRSPKRGKQPRGISDNSLRATLQR